MTELIWNGKYDKDGNKVAPLRVHLPFQTVETVNESAQERQRMLDMFGSSRPSEWRNRLIWGDKRYVLPSLLSEFAGQVDLIYIDPPFDTGADFSFRVQIDSEEFTKEPSIIEKKAYRDTWGQGLNSYLQWLYETLILLRELLHDTGSIYLHIDYHLGHYAKALMDEVFGVANFRNEIIWDKGFRGTESKRIYQHAHDVILFYTKGENYVWNQQGQPYKDESMGRYNQVDEDGRAYALIKRRKTDGTIYYGKTYPKEEGKRVNDVISHIPVMAATSSERTGYDTQKPEELLDLIIASSSNEGDLILDCFVGSGTTGAVAEKLGRRWIACDLGRFAIHTTHKRLLSIPGVKPFTIQNLGKYERQLWQAAEFGEQAEERMLAYRRFILELYHAQPTTGYAWLHGIKAGRVVHVGVVDSPVTPGDVAQIAVEFKRAVGTGTDAPKTNGVDVLGWDFAFELNEVAKQQAAQANINMRFLRIPREVLEKKAVEQGDIHFFELAALSVEVEQQGRGVTLKLTDFVIPPDDVPEDVRQTITHWEQWIDYWAIDWNNQDDTFHNEWQDYRTRKKRELQKVISHTYEQPGTYIIMAKIIDILGNDTTKTLKVEVH